MGLSKNGGWPVYGNLDEERSDQAEDFAAPQKFRQSHLAKQCCGPETSPPVI